MINSKAFQSLAEPVRSYVYQQLKGVICGDDESLLTQKMSAADRLNLTTLLPAAVPELKQVWKRMEGEAGKGSAE